MQAPESSERAVCAEHGLRYDPRISAGCVLCRKHSLPAAPATAKSATKTIVLIVAGIVGVTALFGLYGMVKLLSEAKQLQQDQAERQTTHVSGDKLVSVSVPSTWRRKASELGVGTLILSAPDDFAAITVIDEARSQMEPGYSTGQYLEQVSKAYRQSGTALTMDDIAPPEYFAIDGQPGLRASWKGIGAQHNRVAGYLYVVQSATHFHQFLAIAADETHFARQKAGFNSIVRGAKLNARAPAL